MKIDAHLSGGMKLDEKFLVEFEGLRAHQVRLEGGDVDFGIPTDFAVGCPLARSPF